MIQVFFGRKLYSAIIYIDGDKGALLYRGYPIKQLAGQSSFLNVSYLFESGEFPDKRQLLYRCINSHSMLRSNDQRLSRVTYDAYRWR